MPVPNVCVECRRAPADPVWRPFCSERCRNLDLARWVDGSYRIAAEPAPEADDNGDGQ
jgi:endogenous inhibitor of DNA gyrase (YacG/DUF329 family)